MATHLLKDLSPTRQILNRFVNPIAFGVVCGLVLGANASVYWVLQVVAAIGGVLAGMEHTSAKDGAMRGLVGGFLFGAGILIAHWISGADAKADIGDPEAALIVVTTIAGAILGAIGGAWRGRMEPSA